MNSDFILGILAVQLGFVRPNDVMSAAAAWLADRSRPLADRLVEDGVLTPERCDMLRKMADEAVRANGGDLNRTIDSLGGSLIVECTYGGSLGIDETGVVGKLAEAETVASEPDTVTSVSREEPGRYVFPGGSQDGSEIARGGMGRILLAFDAHVGRKVAVKELLAPTGEVGR